MSVFKKFFHNHNFGYKSIAYIVITTVILTSGVVYTIAELVRGARKGSDYKGATVQVERVIQGDIKQEVSVVGHLTANQSVVIKPQVKGIIKEAKFTGGDHVNEGELLVEIDPALYQAQLDLAEAGLEQTKADFERKQKLLQTKNTSHLQYQDSEAKYKKSIAEVKKAKLDLEHTTIKAPFDGIVGLRNISTGDSVNEQTELLTIVDITPINFDFKVPAKYVKLLSKGQEIKVFVDGFKDKPFEATISAIDAKIDPKAHSLTVRAELPNDEGQLKPGLYGRAEVVAGSKESVLMIPERAVEVSGDEKFVYKILKIQGYWVAQRTPVTTGLREDNLIEISRGLKKEDIVVTAGQVKISDNAIVRPFGVEDLDSVEDLANQQDAEDAESAEGESDAVDNESEKSEKKDEKTVESNVKKEETTKSETTEEKAVEPDVKKEETAKPETTEQKATETATNEVKSSGPEAKKEEVASPTEEVKSVEQEVKKEEPEKIEVLHPTPKEEDKK